MTIFACSRRQSMGYTLVELVLSLALLSIIMVGAGSAMLFAAKAVPDESNPSVRLASDARLVARISDDLAQAKYILEYTTEAVTIVVPDRDGDRIPDRIRYAWGGNSGDPLTYQFNDFSATSIRPSLDRFAITYNIETHASTVPAPLIFGSEKLLSSYENDSGVTDRDVTSTHSFSQALQPILSLNALGFMPTRLEVYAKRDSPTDGVVGVELRNQDLFGPGSNLYATATINEANLSGGFAWNNLTIVPQQLVIPNSQTLALEFNYTGGTTTATRLASKTQFLGGLQASTDSGASWGAGLSERLLYRLYGQEVTSGGDDISISHDHVQSIQISLASDADVGKPISTTTRLLQSPQILDRFWESDFNASPTQKDINGDGVADWLHPLGQIPDGRLVKGVWTLANPLSINPVDAFDGPTLIELRACAAERSTMTITGPLHVDSSGDVLPITVVLEDVGDGSQQLRFYNDLTQTTPYGTVPGLPAGWNDIKILVLPEMDTVALWVNGNLISTALFERQANTGEAGLTLSGNGPQIKITHVRVSVGGEATQ